MDGEQDQIEENSIVGKISKPHEIRTGGEWACSGLGMRLVTVCTTVKGKMACGHCMHILVDGNGHTIPYTVYDMVARWGKQ